METREWSPGIFLAFVGLPTHAKKVTGYERLIPQPFEFIIHKSSYNSKLYNISNRKRRLINQELKKKIKRLRRRWFRNYALRRSESLLCTNRHMQLVQCWIQQSGTDYANPCSTKQTKHYTLPVGSCLSSEQNWKQPSALYYGCPIPMIDYLPRKFQRTAPVVTLLIQYMRPRWYRDYLLK